MLSGEQLLKQIDESLQELTTILDEAIHNNQIDLGWKRLERLSRRIAALLREEVSEEESTAFQFQTGGDQFSNLDDVVDSCRNWLIAFVEELRTHPDIRTTRITGVPPSAKAERTRVGTNVTWDLFVSHASEDKEPFVRGLAEALQAESLKVWYDDFTLTMGDRLRRSIDRGLASSRYGVVVLSPHFFAKEWPKLELDGLAGLETNGRKVILPVWHNIDAAGVRRHSPTLADRVAAKSSDGLDVVVREIRRAIG